MNNKIENEKESWIFIPKVGVSQTKPMILPMFRNAKHHFAHILLKSKSNDE